MKIILVANSTCTFVLQILYEKSAKIVPIGVQP